MVVIVKEGFLSKLLQKNEKQNKKNNLFETDKMTTYDLNAPRHIL